MPSIWIPGRLPSLNELVDYAGKKARGKPTRRLVPGKGLVRTKWTKYSEEKQKWEAYIATIANATGFDIDPGRWCFTYLFCEPNRKRDPTNVMAGGVKFIEDAFVKAHALENDNWANIRSIRSYVCHKSDAGVPSPGILVHVGNGHLEEFEAYNKARNLCHELTQRNRIYSRLSNSAFEKAALDR